MIQEAYVSLETAKLLKEKGFDISTNYSYGNARAYKGRVIDLDTECELKDKGLGGKIKNVMVRYQLWWTKDTDYALPCPTQQMAMRWLREVHKLHIEFVLNQDIKDEEDVIENHYHFNVSRLDRFANEGGDCKFYDLYEQACEAAIRYCLEHLI